MYGQQEEKDRIYIGEPIQPKTPRDKAVKRAKHSLHAIHTKLMLGQYRIEKQYTTEPKNGKCVTEIVVALNDGTRLLIKKRLFFQDHSEYFIGYKLQPHEVEAVIDEVLEDKLVYCYSEQQGIYYPAYKLKNNKKIAVVVTSFGFSAFD